MWCDPQQNLALRKSFTHQPQPALLQVAQPAVDQLAARHGSGCGQIVLLDQHDLEPAAGGVTRDTRAVDAAAHHQQIAALGIGHWAIFA